MHSKHSGGGQRTAALLPPGAALDHTQGVRVSGLFRKCPPSCFPLPPLGAISPASSLLFLSRLLFFPLLKLLLLVNMRNGGSHYGTPMHVYRGTPATHVCGSKAMLGFQSQAAAWSAVPEASCQSLGSPSLVNAGLAGLCPCGYYRSLSRCCRGL